MTLKVQFKCFTLPFKTEKRERKFKSTTEMPKISFKTSKRKKFQKKRRDGSGKHKPAGLYRREYKTIKRNKTTKI